MYKCVFTHFSCVQLFVIPRTVACQFPLSMWFSRQECCGGLSCPPPGIFPTQGSNPHLSCTLHWHLGSSATVRWISYIYAHIYSCFCFFLGSCPTEVITEHWIEFAVLCGKSSLVIYFIYSSTCYCLHLESFFKKYNWTYLQNRSRITGIENKLMVTRGKGRGRNKLVDGHWHVPG